MNADGTDEVRLTASKTCMRTPTFSPDGTKIAFGRDTHLGDQRLWEMNADGTARSQRTFGEWDVDPDWQPA
jgi:Tol biopolymer transport system component